ncbi:MAG: menaquinone biosynthesis protein [Aquificae bacterium]|nr:menaquinone biosynthesis protein [Aquificota bacterium]
MFRVGKVSYKNTLPLFYRVRSFEIIEGVPSRLVSLLRRGEIQAGIVSSAEFFLNPELYLILPGVSISSRGSVCSVKLFSKKPLSSVRKVFITSASLTSRYLLFYIFERKLGFSPEVVPRSEADAFLLIGDEALKEKGFPFVYDLGKEWYEITGLPFVFALFLVRKDANREKALLLLDEVRESLRAFFEESPSALKEGEVYFRGCIDYGLSDKHLRGLYEFYEYLSKRLKRGKPEPVFLR